MIYAECSRCGSEINEVGGEIEAAIVADQQVEAVKYVYKTEEGYTEDVYCSKRCFVAFALQGDNPKLE